MQFYPLPVVYESAGFSTPGNLDCVSLDVFSVWDERRHSFPSFASEVAREFAHELEHLPAFLTGTGLDHGVQAWASCVISACSRSVSKSILYFFPLRFIRAFCAFFTLVTRYMLQTFSPSSPACSPGCLCSRLSVNIVLNVVHKIWCLALNA